MTIVLAHDDCARVSATHLKCDPAFMGVSINFGLSADMHDPLSPVLDAINSLVGSLLPLAPFLDVVALVVQIVKCIQAIPQAVVTLNPMPIVNCLTELIRLLQKVLAMIPPFSLFKLVAGAICLLAEFINGVLVYLIATKNAIEEINAAFSQNLQLGDANLSALIACGEANIRSNLDSLSGMFDLISVFVEVINLFLELAGQDQIVLPSNLNMQAGGQLSGDFLDPIIESLSAAYTVLLNTLRLIPTGLEMTMV